MDKREDVEQLQNGQAAENETKEAEAVKKGDTDSTGSGNAPTEIVEDSPDKETQKVAQLSDVQSPSEPSTSPVEVKTPEGSEPNKTESVPETPQATEPAKAEPEAQPLPVSDSQQSNEVKTDSEKKAEIKEIIPESVAEIKSEPVAPAEPIAEAIPEPVAETTPKQAEPAPVPVEPTPAPEPVEPTPVPEPVAPTPVPETVKPVPAPGPIEPIPVPVAEPSSAPEPVPESVAEPIPAPEPAAEPASAPEPVAEPAPEPVAEPIAAPEPVAEAAPEAVAEAVSEPVVTPVETTAAEQVIESVPSETEPVKTVESPVESKSSEQEPIVDAKADNEVQLNLQSSPVVEAIPEAVASSESVPEIVKEESQPEPVHELGTQNEPSPVAEEMQNRNSVNLIQTEVEINSQSPTEISNPIESEKLNGTSEEPQVNGVESELMNGNCAEESNGIVNSQVTEKGPSEVATMISWKNGGETVVVCGDFCNWEDGHSLVNNDGVFSSKIKLRKGQNHYKFIVDGKEMIDENVPIVELEGHGQVNLLVVPAESD